MNGLQGKKTSRLENPYPGCMGRMVNLFDSSTGPASNRLLTEKAHRDGSPNSRTRQDVAKRALDSTMHNADQIEEKPIAYAFRRTSSKQVSRTPMKLLIAQEMSKDTESKQKPPSVVARLMGLDALPAQQPLSSGQRNSTEGYLCNMALGKQEPHYLPVQTNTSTYPGAAGTHWQQENSLPENQISDEMHPSLVYEKEQPEYKDVYEVWQSSKVKKFKPQPLQKRRYNENLNENKMALVRQKFIEAKRLATDEKLRQSKEFQDALEVLSSNRDLFLKFLQEPNSLFSKQLYDLQSIPPPPQSKRITVLKPSKNMEANGSGKKCYATERSIGSDMKYEKQIKRHDPGNYPFRKQQPVKANGLDNKPSQSSVMSNQSSYVRPLVKADNFLQPTRIVVLKPSPGNAQDIEAEISSPTSAPRPHGKDLYGSNVENVHELALDGPKGSREIARDVTRQMQEYLSCDSMCISNGRDEALISSALSNGYVGDESSFNRSENEYLETGNLSDLEVATPTSKHSWDYMNRLSPNSSSSFSRASCSPESSVSREAKKRLSERWAMMASGSQEQRQVQRISSTLGEMLAFPEIKKPARSSRESSDGELSISSSRSHREEASREPICVLSRSRNDEGGEDSSPRNLPRSRSVPVSSTTYVNVGLPSEVQEAKVGKPVRMEVSKLKNVRSLKGKLSSLFFSRNRKSNREKSNHSSLVGSQDGSLGKDNRGGESFTAEGMPTGVSEVRQHSLEKRSNEDNLLCVTNGSNPNGLLDNVNVGASRKASLPASLWVGSKVETHSSEISACNKGVISLTKSGVPESSSENQDQPSPISVLEGPFEDDLPAPQCSEKTGSDIQDPHTDLHHLESTFINRTPLVSFIRSPSWDDPDLEADPSCYSQKPFTTSSELEAEQERLLFVQNLLSASGWDDRECVLDISRWHSSNCPLDPLLLEKFGDCKEENNRQPQQEAKRRQRRSERRLLFDSANAALVEIVGPILDFKPWARRDSASGTHKGVVAVVGTCLADEVWNWVRGQQFSCEEVELVVRKEVVGPGWVDMLELDMDGIGKEIERQLMDELIEGAVSELAGAF